MHDNVDIQAKKIENISNKGISYNNLLLDEFYNRYIKPVTSDAIADKTDEQLLSMTNTNWIQAFVHAIYSFEGKKLVIDRCWDINKDMFEFFRDQFEDAYRQASLGFGQMVGSTMKTISESRPHLKSQLDKFLDDKDLIQRMREEAKRQADINPHKGKLSILEP